MKRMYSYTKKQRHCYINVSSWNNFQKGTLGQEGHLMKEPAAPYKASW